MVFSKRPILGRYQTKVLLEDSSPFSTYCQLILVGNLARTIKNGIRASFFGFIPTVPSIISLCVWPNLATYEGTS